MKKTIISVILLFSMLLFTGCDEEPAQSANAVQDVPEVSLDEQSTQSEDTYSVTRVVDGDTIIVNIDGTEERIRMIGIDTPESVHPDADRNVEYGKIASEYTKDKLEGKEITLEYDVQERDRYGRILAYVYLDGIMYNKTLLEEGHAKVATYPPNVKYVDDFTALQEQARENEKGVWAYEAFPANGSGSTGDSNTAGSSTINSSTSSSNSTNNSTASSNTSNSNSTNSSPAGNASQPETKPPEVSAAYVGNSNTGKFHVSSCRYVEQMAAHNIVVLETRDEAINGGYDPCKVCKP